MATAGLLALLDDIATLLDDVALLSKTAAKKTAGVLGDDLALNAQQVSGVRAERELPVVWAVARGSVKNKLILVPSALLLSYLLPWLITPLLILGGTFLCYEGFEKIVHKITASEEDVEHAGQRLEGLKSGEFDVIAFEREKIRGAIRTDFILSAEIIVIALGIVQGSEIVQQIVVLSLIAFAMTVFVYGLVAAIVKLDDIAMHMIASQAAGAWGGIKRKAGEILLQLCPYLMRTLAVAGTIAMFLVGGGILVHGIPQMHNVYHSVSHLAPIAALPTVLTDALFNAIVGLAWGALVVLLVSLAASAFARPGNKNAR